MADILVDLLVDGEIVGTDCEHPTESERSTGDAEAPGGAQAPASEHSTSNAQGLGGTRSIGRGMRATVMVTVPVLALLGVEATPATLEGFGPIDPVTARELAATAPGFTRILTHPETGTVLSVGRDRYSAPTDLRRYLRIRDETCRFPGCGRLAVNCDFDHTIDWHEHGPTDHDNLAHLCPGHHHLKHRTRWAVEQLGGGGLQWASPMGRTYLTRPALVMGEAAA